MRLLILLIFFPFLISAQIIESFSDGDFTSNPTWTGDNAEFIVNASQQLQLNNTVAGSSYLSTALPAASLDSLEWNFYVKQSFAPSSSNYGRFYLSSDQQNLEGPLNGYFLQFGEAGSLDAVELFRQNGTTLTSLARGTDTQIAASFALTVKVTRSTSGKWKLYIDPAAGTSYQLQDSAVDNSITTGSFFGVMDVYTLSNVTKFYYDDIYVGAIKVDQTPPSLVSVSTVSSTQVDILFNESVDPFTAQNTTNYNVNNGIGVPSSAVLDGTNPSLVHLTFSTPFVSGQPNTITVSNIEDLSGNPISTTSVTFTWVAPVVAVYKDILINELFPDPSPSVGLPAGEFLELYNRSSKTLNLSGWKLTDGTSTATLGSLTLNPGQYLIITNVADTAQYQSFGLTMGVSSFPSLNNSSDNIVLKTDQNVTIDSVSYDLSWYRDASKEDGGWTLELVNPALPTACLPKTNWIGSITGTGGTPGMVNSVYNPNPDVTSPVVAYWSVSDSMHLQVCFSESLTSNISLSSSYQIAGIGTPIVDSVSDDLQCVYLSLTSPLIQQTNYTITFSGLEDCWGNSNISSLTLSYYRPAFNDVIINEIMADPDPAINLPSVEYLELYNRSNFSIDLSGWTITSGTTTRTIDQATIEADSFLILTSTSNVGNFQGLPVEGVSSFPTLVNSEAALVLRNAQGNVINTVTYNDDWYADEAKSEGGWSLELKSPLQPCAGSENWAASIDPDGGTPGQRNSINTATTDQTQPTLIRGYISGNDTITILFSEKLDSASYLNAAIYSVDNGIGMPASVIARGPLFNTVSLKMASPLQAGIIYTVTISGTVLDCAGNILAQNSSVRVAIADSIVGGDLIINEILADPADGCVDFVEVYNRSQKVADMYHLALSSKDTIQNILTDVENITEEGFLLFPGEYLVLSTSGDIVKGCYMTNSPNSFFDMSSLPSMNIDGDIVVLSTRAGLIIDEFTYTSDMHYPLLNDTKGITLERISPDRPTNDKTNWHSAAETAGFGTPGYKNSQFSLEGTGDEVFIEDELFSPDNDGDRDNLSIGYAFSEPGLVANVTIYDKNGRSVRRLAENVLLSQNGSVSWDGFNDNREKALSGIYIIYFETYSTSGQVKKYRKTCVLATKL